MTDKICECGTYEDCLIDKCTCKCHRKTEEKENLTLKIEQLEKVVEEFKIQIIKLKNRLALVKAMADEGVI